MNSEELPTQEMNDANQRTKQTFTGGNYVDYTYDSIGQLKTAIQEHIDNDDFSRWGKMTGNETCK